MIDYLKRLGKELSDDKATTLAAAQAYYYLLSIVPLLILLLTILPYLQIDQQRAVDFINDVMPPEMASTFQDTILSVISTPRGGLLTVGLLGTLWSASNAVNAFMEATNQAYEVEETRSFIKKKALQLVLTLGAILALAVALVLPIFGGVILDFVNSFLNLPSQMQILFQVLRWVVSILVMSLILAALYHWAPNKKFPFREVIIGAFVATVLWQLVSLGFSFYVSNFGNYNATYGSLGGLIVLMLWFFLTGLILVIGAEINAMNHRKKNVKNQPAQVYKD